MVPLKDIVPAAVYPEKDPQAIRVGFGLGVCLLRLRRRVTVGSEKLQLTENCKTGKSALILTLINRLWIGRGTDPIQENGGQLSGPAVNLKYPLAIGFDKTVAVHFQLWGDECNAFKPSDIIRLSNGIFSYNRNSLLLRAGKRGKIEKVGEFMIAFVETPNMSEIRWVPDPNNSYKYVQEAVISPHSRIFPPKY
ncbi:hypothetical protein L3X38_017557 [Prunus dulcis]|uniref:Uncharacterized protein n=1 Tax=Prunus dulcis TaxID=3755 RepID=A0AAD4ZA59_PRUDU|nr:hypothetical protein L3X38_017557 [Prunus dulcis]